MPEKLKLNSTCIYSDRVENWGGCRLLLMGLSDFAESSELIAELFSPKPLFERKSCHDRQAPQNTPEPSKLIPELFNLNPIYR